VLHLYTPAAIRGPTEVPPAVVPSYAAVALPAAPRFLTVRERPRQAFSKQHATSIAPVAQRDIYELAIVSVGSPEPIDGISGGHQALQTVSRCQALMKFAGASGAADLRRVDIAQPPLHAVLPAGVAIDKARRVAQGMIPAGTDRDCAKVPRETAYGPRVGRWRFSALRRTAETVENGRHGEGACKAREASRDEGYQKSAARLLSIFGGVPGEFGDGVGLRIPGALVPLKCSPIR
jgi:hypothetical protein